MILVVGATGQLGGMITRRLLALGLPVRILVRPTSAYTPLVAAGAHPVFGDLKDQHSLNVACEGVEQVLTTANSALRGGADTVQTVDLDGNRRLIDAAAKAGVQQFVFTSALGADVHSPDAFIQAKARSEAHLRASGLPHTILAPNIYMEVWAAAVVGRPALAGQPVTLVGEGRRKHTMIAMGDVMEYATRLLSHYTGTHPYLPLGGPEALSWRDIVATFERILGRPIPVQYVRPGDPVPGLPPTMVGLLAAMEQFDSPVDMHDLAQAFHITPTPLEAVVRRDYAPALAGTLA